MPPSWLWLTEAERSGPRVSHFADRETIFLQQDNEAFVGSCSQRGPAPTVTWFQISEERGALSSATWLKASPFLASRHCLGLTRGDQSRAAASCRG